jgi:hypothetical protein
MAKFPRGLKIKPTKLQRRLIIRGADAGSIVTISTSSLRPPAPASSKVWGVIM